MVKNKLFIFFLLVFGGIFGQVLTAEAALPLPWEVKDLPQFFLYLFNFALTVAGLIAFAVLIYAGFRYLLSTGNPAIIADAKDQILAAILGLIILFSSYLILYTIDPHLVILKPPGIKRPLVVEPIPPIPPKERIYTFQEIPIGILIARVLEKGELDKINTASLAVKNASEELKKLTEDLEDLTNQCACENTDPNADSCTYGRPCPATECLGDPCPNRGAINIKIADINSKIEEFRKYLAEVEEVRQGLIERVGHLQTGEDYLSGFKWEKGCAKAEIIGHDLMIWEKETREGKIKIDNLFPDFIPGTEEKPLLKRDILNFYCRI